MPVARSSSIPTRLRPRRHGSRSSGGSRTRASRSNSAGSGCVYFETRGVERLYGGLEPALKRALKAVGPGWDARAGAAKRRFAALAAANVARSGQVLVVSDEQAREFLAPLPLTLLPLRGRRREELRELGITKVGELAGLPGGAVAERLGPDGRRAWGLARGGSSRRVRGRKPAAELLETLEFPEAVGNELTLRRSLGVLLDRLLARPERGGRALRKLALSARLVGGGSWRRTVTLRDATAEPARLRAALGPKLLDLPAPVVALTLEVLDPRGVGGQPARARPAGGGRAARASAGRASPGERRDRVGLRLHRRGGRAVVASAGTASAARSARRLNQPAAGARRGARRRLAARGQPVRRSRSCARSGAWSTAGGRRSRSAAATSTSCSRAGSTRSSSTTRRWAAGSASEGHDGDALRRSARTRSTKPPGGAWRLSTRARLAPGIRKPCATPRGGASEERSWPATRELALRRGTRPPPRARRSSRRGPRGRGDRRLRTPGGRSMSRTTAAAGRP